MRATCLHVLHARCSAATAARLLHPCRGSRISGGPSSRATAAAAAETVMPSVAAVPEAVAGLEPAPVWHFFGQLTQIPRPSKHEGRYGHVVMAPSVKRVRARCQACVVESQVLCGRRSNGRRAAYTCRVLQHLKGFAEARQLKWRQDAVGNLVICRPGSGGGEGAPTVVVQVTCVCAMATRCAHGDTTAGHASCHGRCCRRGACHGTPHPGPGHGMAREPSPLLPAPTRNHHRAQTPNPKPQTPTRSKHGLACLVAGPHRHGVRKGQ